jgi:hypothetical protein
MINFGCHERSDIIRNRQSAGLHMKVCTIFGTGRVFFDRTGPTSSRLVEILDLIGKKPVTNRLVQIQNSTGQKPVRLINQLTTSSLE